MAFMDRLRMQSIYGNPSPRTSFGGQDDDDDVFDQFMTSVVPYLRNQEAQRARQERDQERFQIETARGLQAMQQPKQMDVVYQPSISEQISQANIAERLHPSRQLDIQEKATGLKNEMAMMGLGIKQADLERREKETDIKQQRANVYEFKARNPMSKFEVGKDGMLRAINPLTNEVSILGKTGLTQNELADINQTNILEQIGARGKQTEQNIITGEEQKRITKQTPSASTETEQSKGELRRAREAFNTHPEWQNYIKFTADGFEIKPPGSGGKLDFSGRTKEEYNKVKNFIYGEKKKEGTKEGTKPKILSITPVKK